MCNGVRVPAGIRIEALIRDPVSGARQCLIGTEVRAEDQPACEQWATAMVDALQDAADTAACDLDITIEPIPE